MRLSLTKYISNKATHSIQNLPLRAEVEVRTVFQRLVTKLWFGNAFGRETSVSPVNSLQSRSFESNRAPKSELGNQEKNIIALLIFTFVFAASTSLFSQEKKKKPQAPKTRVTLPKDSTKTKAGQKGKSQNQKAKDERLELPDVLIYGEDSERRVAGEKITISGDQPELVNPSATYDPVKARDIQPAAERRQYQQELRRSQSTQAGLRVHGGQYEQIGVAGSLWQSLPSFNYGLDAIVDHTGGQFENSQRDNVTLGGRIGFGSGSRGRTRFEGRFSTLRYGLHGAVADSTYKRDVDTSELLYAGQYFLTSTLQTTLEAGFQTADLQDKVDTLATLPLNVDNTRYKLGIEIKQTIGGSEISLSGSTISDKAEGAINDSAEVKLHEASLGFDFNLGPKLNTTIALDYTRSELGSEIQTRLRPSVRLFLIPVEKIAATLSFTSGLSYRPWTDMFSTNPYISPFSRPRPENKVWDISAGIDWRLTPSFIVKGRFERKKINGLNFFLRDTEGAYTLNFDEFVLGLASIGGRLQVNDQLKAEFSFNIFDDSYKIGEGNFQGIFDVPYRGEFRAPLNIEYSPTEKLSLETNVAWIGDRRISILPDEVLPDGTPVFLKLPSYIYGGFNINYRISEQFGIFASANNILNDAYARWENYQEMGFNALGGFTATW